MSAAEGRPTADTLRASQVWAQKDWYHQIEVLPGLFTPGETRPNLIPVRELLQGCDLTDATCLDIGARDGLMSLLMLRRGAGRAVAYDRTSYIDHIDLVRDTLGVQFDYVRDLPLTELKGALEAIGAHPVDFALYSGVLYHLPDFLGGLAQARSLVRDGGLLLIETIAAIEPRSMLHFNSAARFNDATTYWLPTAPCFESLLRLVGLVPLDCRYISVRIEPESGLPGARVALVCRAASPDSTDDAWSRTHQAACRAVLRRYQLNFEELHVPERPELSYRAEPRALVFRGQGPSIDLYRSLVAQEPSRPGRHDLTRLPLGAAL